MSNIDLSDLTDPILAPFDIDTRIFDAIIRLEKLSKVCNAVIDVYSKVIYIFSIRKFVERFFEYGDKAYVSVEGGNIDYITNLRLSDVSIKFNPLTKVIEVFEYVKDKDKFSIDCLVVDLDEGIVGIVTEDSLIEAFKDKIYKLSEIKPIDIASYPVETIDHDAPIAEALGLMLQKGYRRLPVVDHNDLVTGIINQALIMKEVFINANRSLSKSNLNEFIHATSIGDLNIYPPYFISEEATLNNIFKILMNNPSRSVLIGDSLTLKGIITERDLIKLLINKLI